ncbi:MAG: hypothetical protein AAB631_00135 [Patescibacteria group bacterium]
MCDFISWKKVEKNGTSVLFYLTDKEVFSEEGKKKFTECRDNDVLGHGAIDLFFELDGKGREHEVRDFWNLHKVPEEIAKKLQNFDAHWGKMFASGAFQTDDLEYIVKNGPKDWQEKARKQLLLQRFMVLKTFSLTVPKNYRHERQLDSLKLRDFYSFNDDVTDKNFRNATQKLVPGKTYKVKIVNIGSRSTSEELMGVYAREKAIFVGAHGLSLAWQLKKDEFPVGKWTLSFDKKEALWKDPDGDHRVPHVYRLSVGDYEFNLGYFEGGWNSADCVLCFCDGE